MIFNFVDHFRADFCHFQILEFAAPASTACSVMNRRRLLLCVMVIRKCSMECSNDEFVIIFRCRLRCK